MNITQRTQTAITAFTLFTDDGVRYKNAKSACNFHTCNLRMVGNCGMERICNQNSTKFKMHNVTERKSQLHLIVTKIVLVLDAIKEFFIRNESK